MRLQFLPELKEAVVVLNGREAWVRWGWGGANTSVTWKAFHFPQAAFVRAA